jgi:hypothetical protein
MALFADGPEFREICQGLQQECAAGTRCADNDQRLHQMWRLKRLYLAANPLLSRFEHLSPKR